ncbi:MAG TPA: portal protein, partial [Alphaproteobacteria bacterium]
MTTFDSLETMALTAEQVATQFVRAQNERQPWEALWQDCYDYALPTRVVGQNTRSWKQAYQSLFDATAIDAVDQLASALLTNLVPPWSPFVHIVAGPKLTEQQSAALAPMLERVNRALHDHFRRSNFTVELHQALLDMVTVGTACLRFDETLPGEISAFQFRCIPLPQIYLNDEHMAGLFMRLEMSVGEFLRQCPAIDSTALQSYAGDSDNVTLLYAVLPHGLTNDHVIMTNPAQGTPQILWHEALAYSPFMLFRWQKTGGESYGRSPVMKALP